VLSTAVTSPSASPHVLETAITPTRDTTPSEIGGATWRSGYTTSVSAVMNAVATTIPTSTGGDPGRISSDGSRAHQWQAYPCLNAL
jgi:hypothetical protein